MLRRTFASVTIIGLLPLALNACSEKPPSDPRTQVPLVRTGSVEIASDASRAFTGIVAARVQSELGFRVPGKILERLVDPGQSVKRGQPLMRMDPIDLRLAAHAQQESVAAAKVRADQTAEDEMRYRDLVREGAVSASTYDQIKAAADSAKAQLKAAEAQADVAKNASGYAVLSADADGIVVDTLAEPGQVVSAGQTVVRLAHSGKREAIVHLPETLRPSMASTAQAQLYGNGHQTATARLRQLSGAADAVSRTFEARYVLDEPLANAPLGATVTIQLKDISPTSKPRLQVPVGAIYDAGNGTGVWVLNKQPLHVSWRPIKLVSLSDEAAQIDGNLKVNDQIVTLGAHLLQEGKEVRVAGIDKRELK